MVFDFFYRNRSFFADCGIVENPFPMEASANQNGTADSVVSEKNSFSIHQVDPSGNSSFPKTQENNLSPSNLGFADVLLEAWPLAIQRVNKGRNLAEVLQTAMKERAQLEDSYAERLEKMASRISTVPPTESSGIHDVVVAFKRDAQHRAEQARELAQSIRSDVIEATLCSTIQNHVTVLQQITVDGNHVSEMLKQALHRTAETEKLLISLGRETLKLCYQCQSAQPYPTQPSSQHIQRATKALTRIQEFHILEQRYARQLQITNDARSLYESQMRIILRSLEDMDRKRLSCFKDALRKLMVHQTSALRNTQYDLDLAIRAVESLNEQAELQEFIARAYSDARSRDESNLIPDSARLHPKHWTELCLVPRVPSKSEPGVPRPLHFRHSLGGDVSDDGSGASPAPGMRNVGTGHSLLAVESATTAARNLLKFTTFDRVVQTAAAQLSYIGIPHVTDLVATDSKPTMMPTLDFVDRSTMELPVSKILERLAGVSIHTVGVSDRPEGGNGEPRGTETVTDPLAVTDLTEHYTRMFTVLWNFTDENSKLLSDNVKKLTEDVAASPLHVVTIVSCLDALRLKEAYKLPNMDALHILGIISEVLLEFADRQWDVITARAVMVLSQKFYAFGVIADDPQTRGASWRWPHLRSSKKPLMDDSSAYPETASASASCISDSGNTQRTDSDTRDGTPGEPHKVNLPCVRWFLHRILYHFVLWNRVHFWEEALVLTISEEQQRQLISDAEKAVVRVVTGLKRDTENDEQLTEKSQQDAGVTSVAPLTADLLQNFGACMLAFGIMESQVVALIQKICLQHQLSPEFTLGLLRCLSRKRNATVEHSADYNAILPLASPPSSSEIKSDKSKCFSNGDTARNGDRNRHLVTENGSTGSPGGTKYSHEFPGVETAASLSHSSTDAFK